MTRIGRDVLLYHASPYDLDEFVDFTSFAFDPEEAIPYLLDEPGRLYTARLVRSLRIADEKAIMQVGADDAFLTGRYPFEYVDDWGVRDRLVEQGYEAARFADFGPGNRYEHETLVVFDASDVEIVDVQPVD